MTNDFNLDDINEVMDFVTYIFERGNKFKPESGPLVGYWEWEDYAVILMNTGDVVLTDHKTEKSITVFAAERSLNNEVMQIRGFQHRAYLLKEFLKWENLEKLDKFKVN